LSRRLILLGELGLLGWIASHYATESSRFSIAVSIALAGIAGLLVLWSILARRRDDRPGEAGWWKAVVTTLAGTLVLLGVAHPSLQSALAIDAQVVAQDLMVPRLSGWEAARLENNYYESLVRGGWFTSNTMERRLRPNYYRDQIVETEAARRVPDTFVGRELLPDKSVVFLGKKFTTNRWGMRDQDYSKRKPEGVTRIAVMGASHVMGLGVGDGETFEAVFERTLNERDPGRYEVLNFGCSDTDYVTQLVWLEQRVAAFEPDLVLFVAHLERKLCSSHVVNAVRQGRALPHEDLIEIARRAGLERDMPASRGRRLIAPHADEILDWTVRALVARCEELGAVPVWLFVPLVQWTEEPAEVAALESTATRGGMVPINLFDVFDEHTPESLIVATFDRHPNAQGHIVIAERLLAELERSAATAPLLGARR